MNHEDFFNALKLYNFNLNEKDTASKAYQNYQTAQKAENDFCIIGKTEDLKFCLSDVIRVDLNDTVYDGEKCNFLKSNSNQSGEFLAEDKWSLFVNDAWLLGKIEAGATFYLAKNGGFSSVDEAEKIIKGSGRYPVTVTGRELVGLMTFGYVPHVSEKVLVFEQKKVQKPTFSCYHTNMCNLMKDEKGRDNFDVCRGNLRPWLEQAFK